MRTSLALSAVSGKPFHIRNIRAGRERAGLLRQHLTGVRAVAALCGAEVEGDKLGSIELSFRPGPVVGGDHVFDIGTAGSAGLVLQAVLPVLLQAPQRSTITIVGGTHNDSSPPAPFLQQALLPVLAKMGASVRLHLDRHGFYPAGGGRYRVDVTPARLVPLELHERGAIRELVPVALVSNLPAKIARRQLEVIRAVLGLPSGAGDAREVPSDGPGNVCWIEARCEHVTEVFTGFGRKSAPTEHVAREALDELVAWRGADVPVGPHLADQLLVPLALAGGGSFRTVEPTLHTTTNASVIGQFLDTGFSFARRGDGSVVVSVASA